MAVLLVIFEETIIVVDPWQQMSRITIDLTCYKEVQCSIEVMLTTRSVSIGTGVVIETSSVVK